MAREGQGYPCLRHDMMMMKSIVSLIGTLGNRFSTSSETNIPLLGLIVWRTWINSCVDIKNRTYYMYLNVFNYWRYLLKQIRKVNATHYNSTNAHSYKVVMYIQKLHPFCNTSSPDDGPKLRRRYLGNK